MDARLPNKDKKNDKAVTSEERVVAKANTSRSETSMAEVNSTPSKSEDSQSMGVLPVVLREIRELNKSLLEKIDLNSAQLQTSINGVKATLDNVLTRVTEAENRISGTEDAVSEIKQLTKQLKNDNELLKRKID